MNRPEELLKDFLHAYEQKDLDAISEMVSEDVFLRDWNLEASGKESLIREFSKNFATQASIEIRILRTFSSDAGTAAEIEIALGDEQTLRVVDILGFDNDLKISSIVSYKGL